MQSAMKQGKTDLDLFGSERKRQVFHVTLEVPFFRTSCYENCQSVTIPKSCQETSIGMYSILMPPEKRLLKNLDEDQRDDVGNYSKSLKHIADQMKEGTGIVYIFHTYNETDMRHSLQNDVEAVDGGDGSNPNFDCSRKK